MRVIGLILVVVGALALGYQGFTYVSSEKTIEAGPVEVRAEKTNTVWIPPVVSGLILVSGLVMLALGGRRDAAL